MPSDVEVYNASPVMANNKEAVQQLERDRGDGRRIHGCDRLAMIAKKSQPALGKFWVSGCPLHPTGDAALGNLEAEHEQFAVNAGSTQVGFSAKRKIRSALPSRGSFCRRALSPWRSSASRLEIRHDASEQPFPERPQTATFPIGPETAGHDPEELIEQGQFGPAVSTLEYTELLTKCEVLH